MPSTVVILGGAYGGLHVAHHLLKNNADVKVILVSKNSHFFWNMATVRAIVPGAIEDSKLYADLASCLARYPAERAELVVGSAEAVDTDKNTVEVAVAGGETRVLTYDHLVLATGARCTIPETEAAPLAPWKADGTYEEIQALLAATQAKIKAAKHIVVVGGGTTGIEAAAELGFAHGKGKGSDAKQIVLLSASAQLAGGDAVVGPAAQNELKKLGVDVRTSSAVTAARTLNDGRVELTVAGAAEPLVTDVYLAAVGMTANTEYLDAAYLDERKYVKVDEHYRVSGVAGNNVWAVGDVVSKPRAAFMITQKQAAGVGKNIDLVLHGKAPTPVKLLPVDMMAVATGRSRGVGRVGSFRLPSLMVWLAKGRTLGLQMVPSYVDGSAA